MDRYTRLRLLSLEEIARRQVPFMGSLSSDSFPPEPLTCLSRTPAPDTILYKSTKQGSELLPFMSQLLDARSRPKIDEIFIMTRGGTLVKRYIHHKRMAVDEDIFSGMLTALQSFVLDSFGDNDTQLKEIRLGGFNILIIRGKKLTVAVTSTGEYLKELEAPLKQGLKKLEARNSAVLRNYEGDQELLEGLDDFAELFEQG